jgi:hypothetical protein
MNPISESRNPARKRRVADHHLSPPSSDEGRFRLEDRSYFDDAGFPISTSRTAFKARPKPQPRFALGRLYITANAARALPATDVLNAIARHAAGDWGLLDAHDRQQNERALRQGGRLFSVYQTGGGQRFYVITESSRDLTTVLLPEDY